VRDHLARRRASSPARERRWQPDPAFAFFLITFAGIPLTSGFTGKFAVFQAAIAGGALPLVIVGALSSAILAFPYVRVIVLMFFSDPAPDGPAVVRPSAFTGVAVAVGVVATLALGVVPQPLLGWRTVPPPGSSSAEHLSGVWPRPRGMCPWLPYVAYLARLGNGRAGGQPAGGAGKPMREPE
jgi:hypothetical protein